MSPEDLDLRHVWHPFAPMREWLAEPPLVIDRAEGHYLIDTDGRRYLDGVSSLWLNVHGHRHPTIDAAVRAQLARVAHSTLLGLGSTPSIRLAERLVALAPQGLRRVFYSDAGSTAVEVALKMAFQYQQLGGATRRTTFLTLTDAYHGDTIGAVSLGGIDTFHRIFHPLLFHCVRVPPDTRALVQAIEQHADELAAVVLEPLVQGAAGMRLQPPGLLAAAARACRERDILLIADEVATGFGRTGTLFACEQEGVTPDLMCVAKGLSGGYLPVAATLTTEAVFERFLGAKDERRTFFHGHSFGGNALGCAAALASLDVFEHERTIEGLAPRIAHLAARLAELVAPLPHVFEIRQRGLMVGIELRRDRALPYPDALAVGARVCRHARSLGVILRPLGPVVVLMPPLSITAPEIDDLVTATATSIAAVTEGALEATTPLAPARPAEVKPPPRPAAVRSPRGLLVVGTDTGVGKTTLSRALLRAAHQLGVPLLPCKPVETGCAQGPQDAARLLAASRASLPLDRVCPYPFELPLAPALAARREGPGLALGDLVAAVLAVAADGPVLVETAGGLLAPLAGRDTNAELASALDLPVLLVARNALGTINHTSLVLAELARRRLRLAGLVLVDTSSEPAPDRELNGDAIAELTGTRALLRFPFAPDTATGDADDALAASLLARVDLSAFLRQWV